MKQHFHERPIQEKNELPLADKQSFQTRDAETVYCRLNPLVLLYSAYHNTLVSVTICNQLQPGRKMLEYLISAETHRTRPTVPG